MSRSLRESIQPLVEAMAAEIVEPDEIELGDVPIKWDGRLVFAVRPSPLRVDLVRMIGQVEREFGKPLAELHRKQKQVAVARLSEMGAFQLRKGVEDVADTMAVSRFTIYNYLNATGQPG